LLSSPPHVGGIQLYCHGQYPGLAFGPFCLEHTTNWGHPWPLVLNFLATSVFIGWLPRGTELIKNCRALKYRGACHIARVGTEVFPTNLASETIGWWMRCWANCCILLSFLAEKFSCELTVSTWKPRNSTFWCGIYFNWLPEPRIAGMSKESTVWAPILTDGSCLD